MHPVDTISPELIEHLKKIEPAQTIDSSLGLVLKNQAEARARSLRAQIRDNELRYGITVQTFYDQKINGRDHTWEEEETYFDWISAQQTLEEMECEIAALEKFLTHTNR